MNILIIGAGSMGQAICKGLVNSDNIYNVCVIENNPQNAALVDELNVVVYDNIIEFSEHNTWLIDVCVIAVKPKEVDEIAQEVAKTLDIRTVILSIAAGISITKLQEHLPDFPIVRAMPNLAASEFLSATAMCAQGVSERDESYVREILETFGTVDRVNEDDMDVVTAISGSGPAYYFLLSEYMVDTAVELGLDAQIAHRLVLQTFKGAAALAQENGSFSLLREQVTSPGGTTQSALDKFDEQGLKEVIKSGIIAAMERSRNIDNNPSSEKL